MLAVRRQAIVALYAVHKPICKRCPFVSMAPSIVQTFAPFAMQLCLYQARFACPLGIVLPKPDMPRSREPVMPKKQRPIVSGNQQASEALTALCKHYPVVQVQLSRHSPAEISRFAKLCRKEQLRMANEHGEVKQ